jgi:hypothetical protein
VEGGCFIFTEVARCGPIGKIALQSFFAHHPNERVHVFGLEADRVDLDGLPRSGVVFHSLDNPDPSLEGWPNPIARSRLRRRTRRIAADFDYGHRGTAELWAHIIETRPERYIIHFDSDVIFRAPALDDLTVPLEDGYAIVGLLRSYRQNHLGRDDVRDQPDVAATHFIGFDRTLVGTYPYAELAQMCEGKLNPLGFPVLDFFDPVAFDIILNHGGRIFHVSFDDYGGAVNYSRANLYATQNEIIDFGSKMAHFCAVGSGMNFYKNRDRIREVHEPYVAYGLERYAVFAKLFLDQELDVEYERERYEPLFKVDHWY